MNTNRFAIANFLAYLPLQESLPLLGVWEWRLGERILGHCIISAGAELLNIRRSYHTIFAYPISRSYESCAHLQAFIKVDLAKKSFRP